MKKIGFIGVGNMGGTLAQKVGEAVGAEAVLVSSRTMEKAETFARTHGFTALDNQTLASRAEVIFLGVKPQKMAELLEEIAPVLAERKDRFLLVSMAAGLTMERLCALAGREYPLVRIMPNTPALVGCGTIPCCRNGLATQEDCAVVEGLLKSAGLVTPLEENLMDAASSLSGCGPAFVYLFIEALADGAVACGLPRKTALDFAAQTLLGSAKMVLETGKHPGELKDAVCSPAGSTIAGVMALEDGAFRAAAQSAVCAAFRRNRELGK